MGLWVSGSHHLGNVSLDAVSIFATGEQIGGVSPIYKAVARTDGSSCMRLRVGSLMGSWSMLMVSRRSLQELEGR